MANVPGMSGVPGDYLARPRPTDRLRIQKPSRNVHDPALAPIFLSFRRRHARLAAGRYICVTDTCLQRVFRRRRCADRRLAYATCVKWEAPLSSVNEVANACFVEFHFAEIGFSGTAAMRKADRPQWARSTPSSVKEAALHLADVLTSAKAEKYSFVRSILLAAQPLIPCLPCIARCLLWQSLLHRFALPTKQPYQQLGRMTIAGISRLQMARPWRFVPALALGVGLRGRAFQL